jgi:hypothetical protein
LILIFGNFLEELETLFDKMLPDDLKTWWVLNFQRDGGYLEDLVLLEHLTREVEREIFRVDDTLDEAKPLGNEFLAVIGDEDASDVELDVVLFPLGFEEVKGSSFGDKEDGAEFQLTLDGEVLDGEMVLPVIGERLVEIAIFLFGDVWGVASPQGLGLVQFFDLCCGLLDLLGLLLLVLFLVDFLNLGLLVVIFFLLLLLLFVILYFLLNFFGD